jgi:hypothetical protein
MWNIGVQLKCTYIILYQTSYNYYIIEYYIILSIMITMNPFYIESQQQRYIDRSRYTLQYADDRDFQPPNVK